MHTHQTENKGQANYIIDTPRLYMQILAMRSSRLKVTGQSAVYHCVTRVVAGAMLLDQQAREVLRKQMWYMAHFCGVEILT